MLDVCGASSTICSRREGSGRVARGALRAPSRPRLADDGGRRTKVEGKRGAEEGESHFFCEVEDERGSDELLGLSPGALSGAGTPRGVPSSRYCRCFLALPY